MMLASESPSVIKSAIKQVTNEQGQTTDVMVPVALWDRLLETWQRMAAELEDQEDRQTIENWLVQRQRPDYSVISLESLKAELIADGLL
jgi:hypothetical protein